MSVHHVTSWKHQGEGPQDKRDILGEVLVGYADLDSRLMPIGQYMQRMHGRDPDKNYTPFNTPSGGTAIYVGVRRICMLPEGFAVVHIPSCLMLEEGDFVCTLTFAAIVEEMLSELSKAAREIHDLMTGGA